ncbi:hypothetical protein ACF0H5_013754 [Mactra antiquata]
MSRIFQLMYRLAGTTQLYLVYLVVVFCVQDSESGVCWKYQDKSSGLCRSAIVANMTYDECCNIRGLTEASWTPQKQSPDIFYLSFLSNGSSSCSRCHSTCKTVNCYPGKKCRMVDGSPKCVCKPACNPDLKARGKVCGADGRTYKNYCYLQRTNCVKDQLVTVDYYGKCRSSCRLVRCKQGQQCMQDQNGTPHCVTCNTFCNQFIPDSHANYLCGENGQTYRSSCELKADMCKQGKGIRIAHSGHCNANETCESVKCSRGSTCLKHSITGQPICVDCTARCYQSINVPICATDRHTYSNYCHMIAHRCKTGIYISAHRRGPCKTVKVKLKEAKFDISNTLHEARTAQRRILRQERKRKKKRRNRDRHSKRKQMKSKRRQSKLKRSRRDHKGKISDHYIKHYSDERKEKLRSRTSKKKENIS